MDLFIDKNKILSEHQYGHRENRTTIHAVMEMVEQIAKAIENEECSVGFYFDLQKAFNTIDYSILLRKLENDPWLYWYRQYPSSKLDNLLYIYESGSVQVEDKVVHLKISSTNSIVNLEISSTAVSDSALYYCALRPTVKETHQPLNKNLLGDEGL
uniref:Immunoglobulin V-set domain-containing protein n=1 Tax=Astyanax mexicanus TaxID=7994 RepID=A0A3B1JKJ1_ASTMX